MPVSKPPPSSQIPGKSGGSGAYIGGVLVFAILIGGLVCWKIKSGPGDQPSPPPVPTVEAVNTQPAPQFAPPPPPKIEEVDAGVEPPKSTGTGKGTAGGGPCSGKCAGQASGALQSALRNSAQSAQGCYQRALRTSEVSGSLTVSVMVGPNGQVCSAGISNDSLHSTQVSTCVLGRFTGKSFPAPEGGCVTVNIPISFTPKQ